MNTFGTYILTITDFITTCGLSKKLQQHIQEAKMVKTVLQFLYIDRGCTISVFIF